MTTPSSSTDFLTGIMERKRLRVEAARAVVPSEALRARAAEVRREARPHALREALARVGRVNVIAEFKRASPSKGIIREGVGVAEVARMYAEGGAAAISVLTEEDGFRGSLEDLRAAREAVSLPLLRKDFIFDEYQLYESAEARADALLLIVAALDDEQLRRLRLITEDELEMDALVEVHTEEELQRALRCGAKIVGVNNRDLRTFNVSLETSVQLARQVPAGVLLVSESGLSTREDIERLAALGYSGFLIGETLMRASHPAQALRGLVGDTAQER
ncbi:MAG TPA: indole-3-glycerol phosphate synthase TrpC [Pyrinomonadaceae bacterium]|nr:indole-3-glycerol phosphate synthase TrpC [Pyrinomonadaceae bacterium]